MRQVYAGRMYQNPKKAEEIWINVGWTLKDSQRYPEYESGLSPHLTKESYAQIIDAVKEEFKDPAFDDKCIPFCAMWLCMFTCGICFCPYACLKVKVDTFTKRLDETVQNVGQRISLNARFELKEYSTETKWDWLDSKGIPMIMANGQIGGPPPGCNIILTMHTSIHWPPPRA